MGQLKSCPFCDGEFRQIRAVNESPLEDETAYLIPDECRLVIFGENLRRHGRFLVFKIQFCPICGRQLETPNDKGFPVKVGRKHKRHRRAYEKRDD